MSDDQVKKKRGRKPKNYYTETVEQPVVVDKKKRGRKKKYEIENFEKILNRNEINNFNHHIAYSDDEIADHPEEPESSIGVKKISFGNLNITVSKKEEEIMKFTPIKMVPVGNIVEDEYSDDDQQIPVENIVDKTFCESNQYIKENHCSRIAKKIRVVNTLTDTFIEDSWPEQVDVCCWWCCHKFDTAPCTLPTKYDPLRKRFTFAGIFCSWNCTKAYNFERNDYRQGERAGLISLLIQQIYGIREAIIIKAAPPRQTLKMFGGYKTIEEFRSQNVGVDAYHMNLFNYQYIYPEINEMSSIKINNEKKNLRLTRNN